MAHVTLPPGPGVLSPQMWLLVYQPTRFYLWLRRRYGELATVRLPGNPAVAVMNSEGARQVFTADPDDYDPFLKDGLTAISGPESIWVVEGARHRRERKLLLSAFHRERVCRYGSSVKDIVIRNKERLQPGRQIRAYDLLLNISRDIILGFTFGIEGGPLLDEGRRVLDELIRCGHPLSALFSAFRGRWFPPWARFLDAKHEFSLFLAQRLAERRRDGRERDDVLGLMLAARYEGGVGMSDQEILEELIPLMFAAQTTAVALSWAIYDLGRNPAVLGRLREELEPLGPEPAVDEVAGQPYLKAVCDETLRLHPIVPEIVRVARSPRQLLGCDIPANTGIGVSLSALHHDPETFPAPEDFRPERFIARTYAPFEYVPFSGGHRRCPGAYLAKYQLSVVLATIIMNWDFELAGEDCEIRHGITTIPRHGVPIEVKRQRVA